MFSCEYCGIFKNTYFEEHLPFTWSRHYKQIYCFPSVSGKASSYCFKDTHRVRAHSDNTQTLTKSMNMDIWVVSALDKLFIYQSFLYLNSIFIKIKCQVSKLRRAILYSSFFLSYGNNCVLNPKAWN